MIEKQTNIFEEATQLVSLDCSSIVGQNMTYSTNLSHQSLHQSILNFRKVLPTFSSEFAIFKEEIIEMFYFMINKLMSVIKNKTAQISRIKLELQSSQSLNCVMKKQVIQLKEMINEFMQSYKKEMGLKEKEISTRQKEIGMRDNQINQLKTLLSQNSNNPSNFCHECHSKLKVGNEGVFSLQDSTLNELGESQQQANQFLIKNYQQNNEAPLVEMSESILCNRGQSDKKMSLQIILQQPSDINSLTDYLQSQRCSQKLDSSKGSTQLMKSSRTYIDDFSENEPTGKRLNFDTTINTQFGSNQNQTMIQSNSLMKLNLQFNTQDKKHQDSFSSRITTKKIIYETDQVQRERRCSEQLLSSNFPVDSFKLKPVDRTVLTDKIILHNQSNYHEQKPQLSLKAQLEQISKSSSSSDIMHFGDTEKINVNLPKMFETPKNMNFVKKNSSRHEQKLKTEPSPRSYKYQQLDKENIQIEYQSKPLQMGRKIFARKKMIMTHAKANQTSRNYTNKRDELKNELEPRNGQIQTLKKNNNFIEIKFVQSPQKQLPNLSSQHEPVQPTAIHKQLPVANPFVRSNNHSNYNSINSNISTINQSIVKSHHLYHSTGKYQAEQTPKNIHKITMTPGKLQKTTQEKMRSCSKSKEKLKVTSKSTHQAIHSSNPQQQKKQKFLTETNQPTIPSSAQGFTKMKNKNISVHIGSNSKMHLHQKLSEIKTALTNYDMAHSFTTLKEVFFDGKVHAGQKEGLSRVVYDNGLIYEGQIRQGKRSGDSKLTLNGIDIYEGQFSNNWIEGQGYLKYLRFFINPSQCPKILQDASYFGKFSCNKFDGMGTLFLNQKQKIVSRFLNGIPYGEVTLYTENDIQFGHWPNDQII